MSHLLRPVIGAVTAKQAFSPVSRALFSTALPRWTPASEAASGSSSSPSPHFSGPHLSNDAPRASSSRSQPNEQARRPRNPSSNAKYNFTIPIPTHIALPERNIDPERWWHEVSAERADYRPNNKFSGRSVTVTASTAHGLGSAFNFLNMRMKRSRLHKTKVLSTAWEQPSNRRVRLRSERHRLRFRAMVRQKVRELTMTMRRA